MKKRIILLLSLLLLSGCTVNYNLKIENNTFNETISSTFKNSSFDQETSVSYSSFVTTDSYPILNNEDIKYNKSSNTKGNKTTFNMNYTYNIDEIKDSFLFDSCFDNYVFLDEGSYYYISLSGKFYCLYSNEIKVNIKTENLVSSTNAIKKGNTYSWTINKDNIDNVDINIRLSKDKKIESKVVFGPFRIIVFIFLIVVSGAILLLIKKKKNNEV